MTPANPGLRNLGTRVLDRSQERTPIRTALSLLLMCFLMTSCGLTRQSMDIDYNDRRLNDGLESLLHQGKSGRLSDFTAWRWDEVHLFHEYSDQGVHRENRGCTGDPGEVL